MHGPCRCLIELCRCLARVEEVPLRLQFTALKAEKSALLRNKSLKRGKNWQERERLTHATPLHVFLYK